MSDHFLLEINLGVVQMQSNYWTTKDITLLENAISSCSCSNCWIERSDTPGNQILRSLAVVTLGVVNFENMFFSMFFFFT